VTPASRVELAQQLELSATEMRTLDVSHPAMALRVLRRLMRTVCRIVKELDEGDTPTNTRDD
jgi:hypothetical protein